MADKSGVALYSDFSGLSAFLKISSKQEDAQLKVSLFRAAFSNIELQLWLGISDSEANKLGNWLVQNKFLVTQS